MEHRRTRRFSIELPLSIVRAGSERVDLPGYTKNISSSGVLFTTGLAPELGGPIEYIITLISQGQSPVNLRCMGKVVRSQRLETPNSDLRRAFVIAATLERYEFVREREMALVR